MLASPALASPVLAGTGTAVTGQPMDGISCQLEAGTPLVAPEKITFPAGLLPLT